MPCLLRRRAVLFRQDVGQEDRRIRRAGATRPETLGGLGAVTFSQALPTAVTGNDR
jgi:hypothetical protein